MSTPDQQIAALKRERAGYAARGLTDRVKQVDEQLAQFDATEESGDDAPAEVDPGPVRANPGGKFRKAVSNGE